MTEVKTKLKTMFTIRGEDGSESKYAVRRPTPKEMAEGQKFYNRAFKDAVESDAPLREKVDAILRKQNLWDDDKQTEAERIQAEIIENEKLLARGYRLAEDGTKLTLKLSEAREVALKLWGLRRQQRDLLSVRTQLDSLTVQAQADNARFNHYVARCLVYNEGDRAGKPVFKDVDDYLEHAAEPHAFEGARHLVTMLVGGDDPDWEKKLPENRFLLKYHFVNEKLQLINREGKLIDAEGRLVNEQGHYINEQGQFVNRDGDRVDANGDFVFEDAVEFIDDINEAVGDVKNDLPTTSLEDSTQTE